MHYDIFNGDADGILSLLQLRKAEPVGSGLITGVKRDIALLSQVVVRDNVDSVTVLDISMAKNLPALRCLLERKIPVFYCDHHRVDDVPNHPYLTTVLDFSPTVCTALLVSKQLQHRYIDWAIAAAFGDNLLEVATQLAIQNGFSSEQIQQLQCLGTLVNYNSYGSSPGDLTIAPATLFQQLMAYDSPFDVVADKQSAYARLRAVYLSDKQQLDNLRAEVENPVVRVFILPDARWARRVSGVLSNACVYQQPDKAHAILTLNSDQQSYTVSVRAPLNQRIGADEVCRQFAGGGGRGAAGGINALSVDELERLVTVLTTFYGRKTDE